MKRIFALFASAVLAAGLLAAPCFAAEPEDLPEQPGVTDPEPPEDPQPPEEPDEPGAQPCDTFPGNGDAV